MDLLIHNNRLALQAVYPSHILFKNANYKLFKFSFSKV